MRLCRLKNIYNFFFPSTRTPPMEVLKIVRSKKNWDPFFKPKGSSYLMGQTIFDLSSPSISHGIRNIWPVAQ